MLCIQWWKIFGKVLNVRIRSLFLVRFEIFGRYEVYNWLMSCSSEIPTFSKNNLAMQNIAALTGGKPIAV
jgi:hypothetical protein